MSDRSDGSSRGGRSRFPVRSTVVHPAHGVAQVVGHEKHELDGRQVTYLVLDVPAREDHQGRMRISVPMDTAEELGVRVPVDSAEAAEVLELLAVQGVRVPTNWSRRFKNHQEKLRSGDIYECAEVVRNLARRDQQAKLSAGEKTMYERARHRLIGELAASWGIDRPAADQRVAEALAI